MKYAMSIVFGLVIILFAFSLIYNLLADTFNWPWVILMGIIMVWVGVFWSIKKAKIKKELA